MMSIDEIMGDRFGKYSKYIIQDRALPDVRDGLKPVQRRILYAMYKEGNLASRPYRKSAKTVGNVIGNYHPHGDTSVYEAMVRLSQEWKMRVPLIDMQGNNGSIDNDPAAAMRYTEARLSKIAEELLEDIDKETVAMSLNFDDTEYEPTVLPAHYPNLLVNGATGISAGYATDIPPHNLEEVIDATIYRLKHSDCTLEELTQFIKGPDFPTGGVVEGKEGIVNALKNGKGKVILKSKVEIKEEKNLNKIIVTEIPYEVNKSELVRQLDNIKDAKNVDGIIEVRDESDRNGLTIVIELRKEVDATNILNYLYKNSYLQKNYNYNMVAIKDRKPVLMGIEEIIDGYITHQKEVVTKRSIYDLNKAKSRKHIVEGLIKAVSILDEVVKTIRASQNKNDAKINLQVKYDFTEKQAEAIVMLQLYRLTNTDIVSLENENEALDLTIKQLEEILNNENVLVNVIIEDLSQIKEKYPMPRLTQIKDEVETMSINVEEMIIPENVYVSITRDGYIKRVSQRSYNMSEFSKLGRKEEDSIIDVHYLNTLDKLLLFTNTGRYIYLPVHKLEEFKWRELGKHISYLVKINNDEKIIKSVVVKDFSLPLTIIIGTRKGQIKRVLLKDFEAKRYNRPLKCINLKEDDEVIDVALSDSNQAVIITTRNGNCAIYNESEISVYGLNSGGVKSIKLTDDEVISINLFQSHNPADLIIINKDMGIKQIPIADIPLSRRGNKGASLYSSPKSRKIETIKAFIGNEKFTLYNKDEWLNINLKDYKHHTLKNRFTSIVDAKPDCFIYNANTYSTDLYKIEKNENEVVDFEPLTIDDFLDQ